MKKILLLFLTLTLVLTSASVFASCDNSSDSPDETNYSEGLEYN